MKKRARRVRAFFLDYGLWLWIMGYGLWVMEVPQPCHVLKKVDNLLLFIFRLIHRFLRFLSCRMYLRRYF